MVFAINWDDTAMPLLLSLSVMSESHLCGARTGSHERPPMRAASWQIAFVRYVASVFFLVSRQDFRIKQYKNDIKYIVVHNTRSSTIFMTKQKRTTIETLHKISKSIIYTHYLHFCLLTLSLQKKTLVLMSTTIHRLMVEIRKEVFLKVYPPLFIK